MRRFVTVFSVIALATPFFAGAQSVSDLQAEVQALLAQITALQQQIGALVPVATTSVTNIPSGNTVSGGASSAGASSNTVCPVFNYTLSRGQSGDAVSALQKFLAGQGFLMADSVTGFYGALTESAVRNFQTQQQIVSSGDAATTGWGAVGKTTSAAIVRVCSSQFTSQQPPPSVPPNATACTALSLVCPAGKHDQIGANCSHTCVSGASNVSCPSAPQPVTSCTSGWQPNYDANGCTVSYACTITPGNPAAASSFVTLSASPMSGPASLQVTFLTTSAPPDTYSMNFGDGFAAQMSIQTCSNIVANSCTYQVQHTYGIGGAYTATLSSGGAGQLGTALITVH